MILSHRAALNEVQLDSLDDRILVQGGDEAAGKYQIASVSLFGGVGQRITNRHRDYLEVTVRFSLRVRKSDMQTRSALLERINAWAEPGGWLTLNYKPGRRLRVVCAQYPAPGDPWNWTGVYAVVFRAYAVPFWQQNPPGMLSATGSGITRSIGVAGNTDTVLELSFKNTSGAVCGSFTVDAGSSMISLSALGLASGETLHIDHTVDGLLRIRVQSSSGSYRSVLDKRTPESSDDLWVPPGTATVSVTAQRTGTLTLSCAGRYT